MANNVKEIYMIALQIIYDTVSLTQIDSVVGCISLNQRKIEII